MTRTCDICHPPAFPRRGAETLCMDCLHALNRGENPHWYGAQPKLDWYAEELEAAFVLEPLRPPLPRQNPAA